MRSPIVKVGAVVVMLAVVGGLFLRTGTRSGMALADALAKMEQIDAFAYKMSFHRKGSTPGEPTGGKDAEMCMVMANEYGARMDIRSADPNGRQTDMQMYWLPRQKTVIMLMPALKTYERVELDDSMFEKMKKEKNDPRQMVQQILDCRYEKLGKSTIDGVEVEGFRTTDPAYVGTDTGEDVDVKIWVGLKTGLPVRMEMKTKNSTGTEMEATAYDFRWNIPVSAAEFTPAIPADFTDELAEGTKTPPITQGSPLTEETAVAGLRLCRELRGKYPDNLDFMTLAKAAGEDLEEPPSWEEPSSTGEPPLPDPKASPEELRKWQEESKKWREERDKREEAQVEEWKGKTKQWSERQKKRREAKTRTRDEVDAEVTKLVNQIMPIHALGSFYLTLVAERKDPAYYGKIVKPGDSARVLLRWKEAGDQYRVIFGDLRVLTVNSDTLKGLETALPK